MPEHVPPGVEAGFKRSRGSGASQNGGRRGRTLGCRGWVLWGQRRGLLFLTLDFYAPVLFATKGKQKSDRRVLVHSSLPGRPAQPLAPAGVWQVGTVPLSVLPGTWPRLCHRAVDRDRRHALRPHPHPEPAASTVIQPISTDGETEAQGGWRTARDKHLEVDTCTILSTLALSGGCVIAGPHCPQHVRQVE